MAEVMAGERCVVGHLISVVDGRVALLGCRCGHCSAVTFPAQQFCPRCTRAGMVPVPLARTGTLWTYTVQGFRPKLPYDGPEEFSPYAVGYVDLGEVLVESRLDVPVGHRLVIGEPMGLVMLPYTRGVDGEAVTTFAFRPLAGVGEERA